VTPAGEKFLRDTKAKELRHLRVLARALGLTMKDLRALVPSHPEAPPKPPRGFAALSPTHRARLAARGGAAAVHRHRFTSEEARAAWQIRDQKKVTKPSS